METPQVTKKHGTAVVPGRGVTAISNRNGVTDNFLLFLAFETPRILEGRALYGN